MPGVVGCLVNLVLHIVGCLLNLALLDKNKSSISGRLVNLVLWDVL